PTRLAEAEKMPGILIRSKPQVVKAKKHHARRPVRSFKRRLPRQRKVRHPLIQPWTKIRSPEVLPSVFPVECRNAAFGLQYLAGPAVNFPTDIKGKLWFYRHGGTSGQRSKIFHNQSPRFSKSQ